ncbi:MAG TPA: LCP family protein [Candidatus Limiplasma sp.]|nr:LCP family protein [Candidatus Limiplasma sp.]
MNRMFTRLLATLLMLTLALAIPFQAMATSSLDQNTEDTDQSIANNPDLTDAEKQQWQEWASEENTDGTADAADDALVSQLEDATADNTQLDPEDLANLELNDALPTNVINILLLGVDNRSVDLKSGLSDAVIICSLNTDDGSVKLTSITRDTEVVIPGYKNKRRINCAFKFGSKDGDLDAGAQLAMKTVNRNFQMNIQRYVVVNIHGLASIIDSLGGVDMDMSSKEASRINFELRKEPMDNVKRAKVEAKDGVQHLDGMQAVTYARIRGIDNDFMRSERQRKLLATLMAQVMKDVDISKLVGLIQTALPFGATNLTASDMVSFGGLVIGGSAMSKLQSGESVLEQFRVPMDDTWKYDSENGATMTAFKNDKRLRENIEAMQKFIYGESYYKE